MAAYYSEYIPDGLIKIEGKSHTAEKCFFILGNKVEFNKLITRLRLEIIILYRVLYILHLRLADTNQA